MGSLSITNSVTLDGVMQDPSPHAGDVPSDPGFPYAAWAMPYSDADLAELMGSRIATAGAEPGLGEDPEPVLLLGRRTYELFAATWPHAPADNPYTQLINAQRKYVVSTTLAAPLAWNNSQLVDGGVDGVAAIKARHASVTVLGSGELTQALLAADLVDELTLLVHPLVLGTGRRLFPDGGVPATLELTDTAHTPAGVILATYRRR